MGVFNTNIMLANVYGRLSAAGTSDAGPSAAEPSATIEHSSIYIYSIYFLCGLALLGKSIFFGKRFVPEKEYIHMISSYIAADWSNIE